MVLVYTISLFWAAFLLFVLQPMVGKVLLPTYGGTPAVWNVCLVFFQVTLLAGYFYASQMSRLRALTAQAALHIGLSLMALYFWGPQWQRDSVANLVSTGDPTLSLLGNLLRSIGLPFLLLSASSSLLQSWFGRAKTSTARDPYFLFAASNLGSLIGLLAYPLFLEPSFSLSHQFDYWVQGYWLLLFLLVACVLCLWRAGHSEVEKNTDLSGLPSWTQRWHWFLAAFVPASLLIGVSSYLSTDIASFPMLWIIPLALYLISFIFGFSNWANRLDANAIFLAGRLVAFGACVVLLGVVLESNQPAILFFGVHLIVFFFICFLCHLRLARTRPHRAFLPQFYLWLAFGGACGGVFNTLLAPAIFSIVAEYPLMIFLGTLFRNGDSSGQEEAGGWRGHIVLAASVALVFVLLGKIAFGLGWGSGRLVNLFVLGPPMLLAYRFVKQPRRFALALLGIYVAGVLFYSGRGHSLLFRERTFFGTNKIELDPHKKFVMLFHGSTLHGQAIWQERSRAEPLAYYSRRGPAGELFSEVRKREAEPLRIGIVGLGTGSLAAYAKDGDDWTFYELDPAVLRIAKDSGYFRFLRESEAASKSRFEIGDARLNLLRAEDSSFNLLVLDAFSSDAIPTHLLTREALALYWQKLRPGGYLAFHISSRYFDLRSVLSSLAQDGGVSAYYREQEISEEQAEQEGVAASVWVVMGRGDWASPFLSGRDWKLLEKNHHAVWTDDFSNILSAFL